MCVCVSYRHAVEGQLSVNFELVGRGHASAGVHQAVTELRERKEYLWPLKLLYNGGLTFIGWVQTFDSAHFTELTGSGLAFCDIKQHFFGRKSDYPISVTDGTNAAVKLRAVTKEE